VSTATNLELARARAEAAERLETAIAALGSAYRAYAQATSALEFRLNLDLARYLEPPIVIHLAMRGGLTDFLERRLVGPPANLRALVEAQPRRNRVPSARA
jgi:hypothetical protein